MMKPQHEYLVAHQNLSLMARYFPDNRLSIPASVILDTTQNSHWLRVSVISQFAVVVIIHFEESNRLWAGQE